jgi:hypothetical protein
LLAVVAAIAGAINSVAGGGSFLTFPSLIFAGVPPIVANATNNTAMWVGVLGSVRGYRREIRQYRGTIVPAMVISLAGSLIGAILLLRTPPSIFERMIPWLLLFATVVFALSPYFTKEHKAANPHAPWQLVLQFVVAIYGGYFGAGIGILMLAILSFSGLPNMNAMNGIKNMLSAVINGVALVPFVIAGIVAWPIALVMAVFAVAGGYAGSRFFRLVPSPITRRIVLAIGACMTTWFFYKTFHG